MTKTQYAATVVVRGTICGHRHKRNNIVERAIVRDGAIAIAPVMYVALSYDHRIIDGKESVGFLVAVKEALESPEELLMDGDVKKALEL